MTPPPARKIRVAILYGGRSPEHEISCMSAASIIRHLDPRRYEVMAIGINRQGHWLLQDTKRLIAADADSLRLDGQAPKALPRPHAGSMELYLPAGKAVRTQVFDVVFPVLHGPLGEDGTVQGMLEMMGVPYVGSGVLSSSICMDKDLCYQLAMQNHINVAPYLTFRRWQWLQASKAVSSRVGDQLGWPVFVKPANGGSSIGITKVKKPSELEKACQTAFRYDEKALIQKAIEAREIECAVLGDDKEMLVARPGEVIPRYEFYSYQAKYLDPEGAQLHVPVSLGLEKERQLLDLAKRCFQVMHCHGMARVDFLLDKKTARFYFSEINTIPGFTRISMYPKMMEASGVPYEQMLSRLISLALKRGAISSSRAMARL